MPSYKVSDPFYNSKYWRDIRDAILERDGHFPPFGALADELDQARALWAGSKG